MSFSALQQAEIAEIQARQTYRQHFSKVSVLFNEPKLLKSKMNRKGKAETVRFSALQRAEIAEIGPTGHAGAQEPTCFSALQRAEIAEIVYRLVQSGRFRKFQCSSTSRNC